MLNPLLTLVYDRLRPAESLGDRGERIAERYLLKHGYVIVDRGYSDNLGEIDLIAVEDKTVVFVEVKTRSSDFAGNPFEAVDDRKQEKITKTALSYMKQHDLLECRVRFDVVSIIWPETRQAPQIEHFENAFEASKNVW